MFIGIAFVAFYIFITYNKYNTKKVLYMKHELENKKFELEKCKSKYSPPSTDIDKINIYTKLHDNDNKLNVNNDVFGAINNGCKNILGWFDVEKDSIYNNTFETYDHAIDILNGLNGIDYSYMHHWQI
jgi:hypothetical protein